MDQTTVNTDTAVVNADTVVSSPSRGGTTSVGTSTRTAVLATPVMAAENSDRVDDRRDWALYTVIGFGLLMVIFSTLALFFVRTNPGYTFYLGLSAMVNTFVVITGLLGLLVKRSLVVSRTGIEVHDSHSQP